MEYFIGFIIGLGAGVGIVLIVVHLRSRSERGTSEQTLQQMRETFGALAAEALDANAKRLSETAGAALEGKKALIDQSVKAVNDRLKEVREFLQRVEGERKKEFSSLGTSVTALSDTAGKLHQMLASTQRRGAWGERMAEDILRLVGMEEGVNYTKQSGESAEAGRPDFTFLLPNDLKANMDVKFPLESYKAYIDATTDDERDAQLRRLVVAVRGHVRTIAGRKYIDPDVPTVPYVIVFIPSEQIYGLVLGAEADLIDDALKQRVVLASPLTLYAMLAVIRQAAENANVMRTADEVIALLTEFNKQWANYSEEFGKLGDRIDLVTKQYETLSTTRTNMLQRPLDKIETLRQSRALPEEE
jgi:DNA recombination protein RmuC